MEEINQKMMQMKEQMEQKDLAYQQRAAEMQSQIEALMKQLAVKGKEPMEEPSSLKKPTTQGIPLGLPGDTTEQFRQPASIVPPYPWAQQNSMPTSSANPISIMPGQSFPYDEAYHSEQLLPSSGMALGTKEVEEKKTPPSVLEDPLEAVKKLEGKLRFVQGFEVSKVLDPQSLSLVKDLEMPAKFKQPDFHIFDGKGMPLDHLTMYCHRMHPYLHNEKLLIHCFQDSLDHTTRKWFNSLDPAKVSTWKDLAESFMAKYKHNQDMAPTRFDLQNTLLKEGEGFREYALRWRELAAQVVPPILEKELIRLFRDTLPDPYPLFLASAGQYDLTELIQAGVDLERSLKKGSKIVNYQESQSAKGLKAKKAEVHAVSYQNPQPIYPTYPPPTYTPSPTSYTPPQQFPQSFQTPYRPPYRPMHPQKPPNPNYQNPRNNFPNPNLRPVRPFEQFDPISMSYAECFSLLRDQGRVCPIPGQLFNPPYPPWYNPNQTCEYHENTPGHSINDCRIFKRAVQTMKNAGWLNFEGVRRPNVNENPLPDHREADANMVEEVDNVKRNVDEVTMRLGVLFGYLRQAGLVESEEGNNENCGEVGSCQYHGGRSGHSIEDCMLFKERVQQLMNEKKIIFEVRSGKMDEVNVIEEGLPRPMFGGQLEPITLRYYIEDDRVTQPTPYYSGVVPWNYSDKGREEVGNISGVGGMTLSGRCYTPDLSRDLDAEKIRKGKQPMIDDPKARMPEKEIKRPVTEEEVQEFLKIIKQSEYMVVEQLKKMPAKISIFELMMSSEPHRKALMKILNQAYVPEKIPTDSFEGLVGNILVTHLLSFTDEELPMEGRDHNKALYITALCMEKELTSILIDDGSALNVMPKETLIKLSVDFSNIKASSISVRAFDGTRRAVEGEIEIPVMIRDVVFRILFIVMDIVPSYSCLLGRPWIHAAGAVPSSLYQKLKFVHKERVYTINGQSEWMVASLTNNSHIDAPEEGFESPFQSFEIANAICIPEGTPLQIPRVSREVRAAGRAMLRMGFCPGSGLGKNLQGIRNPIEPMLHKERRGLGYRLNMGVREKFSRGMMVFPWLYDTFVFGGMLDPEDVDSIGAFFEDIDEQFSDLQIAMLEGESSLGKPSFVVSRPPGFKLTNWMVQELATPVNKLSE
ncbi:uncharacterized protein LOC119993529 [Tripterygium wilfordii]|uniref:uncharacterized protein LOC119993529 n=1 Tax=Tripterygium wilfordii TaxID=458696 RepID=UPI0018F82248|nr:uncharacterized protein LOC119993529 [Tripterygium wilfordii]